MVQRTTSQMLAVIVFAAACLSFAALRENMVMAYDGKVVTVTEKENGKKVTLSKGDTLVVRLEGNAGTAYTWKIGKHDPALLKAQGKPEIERPEKPLPGGKVTQVFRFRAESAGASDLEMDYAQAFDKDKAPARRFKFSVAVE